MKRNKEIILNAKLTQTVCMAKRLLYRHVRQLSFVEIGFAFAFRIIRISYLLYIVIILSACNRNLSYKPFFLPIEISFDHNGDISVSGKKSIVTFLGEFSIGAQYYIKNDNDDLVVIIRNRNNGKYGTDSIFRIQVYGETFEAILNGTNTIHVEKNKVLIDVTKGSIKNIKFIKLSPDSSLSKIDKAPHSIICKVKRIFKWIFLIVLIILFIIYFIGSLVSIFQLVAGNNDEVVDAVILCPLLTLLIYYIIFKYTEYFSISIYLIFSSIF